jgi:hypothetical protein
MTRIGAVAALLLLVPATLFGQPPPRNFLLAQPARTRSALPAGRFLITAILRPDSMQVIPRSPDGNRVEVRVTSRVATIARTQFLVVRRRLRIAATATAIGSRAVNSLKTFKPSG